MESYLDWGTFYNLFTTLNFFLPMVMSVRMHKGLKRIVNSCVNLTDTTQDDHVMLNIILFTRNADIHQQ